MKKVENKQLAEMVAVGGKRVGGYNIPSNIHRSQDIPREVTEFFLLPNGRIFAVKKSLEKGKPSTAYDPSNGHCSVTAKIISCEEVNY